MLEVFNSFKNFLKLNQICIDNKGFRLHYKVTAPILFAFSVLVTSKQYLGDPIDCLTASKDDIPNRVVDTYCWIHSTYTLPDALNKTVGVDVPHPGIENAKPGARRTYHTYYQWVCFMLFFQAVLFYLPRYLWKTFEKGTIKNIILDLNNPIVTEDDMKIGNLVDYLFKTFGKHNAYAYQFFLCEILNFVNVVGQIYFVNSFLGGEFTTYGPKVISFLETSQEDRVDPMIKVFPRVTKCTFHRYGPGGGIQTHDVLCILPINIINEKIYVFMWFWFVILAVLSGLIIPFRLVLRFSCRLQERTISSRSRMVRKSELSFVIEKSNFGDWFLLNRLAINMEPMHFKTVISELAVKLGLTAENQKLKMKDCSNV